MVTAKNNQIMKEFEQMRNMAELKALSNFSLENPLNNSQFKRMMDLKKEVGL
jgi:hypothetical protein